LLIFFVQGKGIPLRPYIKNAIFAPELYNKYGGSAFPAVHDLLHEIHKLEGEQVSMLENLLFSQMLLQRNWALVSIALSGLCVIFE
jgi:hypothetical protein